MPSGISTGVWPCLSLLRQTLLLLQGGMWRLGAGGRNPGENPLS